MRYLALRVEGEVYEHPSFNKYGNDYFLMPLRPSKTEIESLEGKPPTPEEKQGLEESLMSIGELAHHGQALPIFKGDRVRSHQYGEGLRCNLTRERIITMVPDMIEVLTSDRKVKAQYFK